MFLGLIDHDPASVQAGPVIERLLDEALGHGWNHFSLLANISYPHCHPQPMHMDQTFVAPFHPVEAPVLVNVMYVLQDVDERNGGTLLVPGTHRPNGTDGELFGPIPRPINLEAPAGTILVFDGRLLHGGAVNHTDQHRYVLTNSCVKPWIRQQENWLLGVAPEVLDRASDKALWRMGFSSVITANLVEGYGYRGSGKVADPSGATVAARRLFDNGGYRHVGELSPDRLHDVDRATLSLAHLQERETFRTAEHLAMMAAIG
jgi:ectoine hydroxylase-related dioxygenase (phytanoyl-CoA dioxygenase family)